MSPAPSTPGLGSLQNEGDLKRWLQRALQEPGAVELSKLVGTISPGKLSDDAKALFPQLVSAVLGAKVDFGADSMTGNNTVTQSKTINHGLGVTPVAVLVTVNFAALNPAASGFSSTQFTVSLRHIDNANWSSAQPFYWLAIG